MSEIKCPTCGESEPGTGNCGTSDSDTKALCKVQSECSCRNESQECTEASNCRVLKMFEPTIAAVAQGEPVAWRLNHGNGFFSEFTTGVPTEVAKAHWKRMGVTIEYAYLHPAPAVAVDEQFAVLIKKANDQAEHFEREWYLRGDELEALEQVNAQLLEALKELMYARTDKAEGMADAAIAQAEAAKGVRNE